MVSTADSKITIQSFTAEPLQIRIGEKATLDWDVLNATEVEISGIGPVDPSGGSVTVSPTETTTYTLTARNLKREVQQTVEVTVDSEITILRFTAKPSQFLRWLGHGSHSGLGRPERDRRGDLRNRPRRPQRRQRDRSVRLKQPPTR